MRPSLAVPAVLLTTALAAAQQKPPQPTPRFFTTTDIVTTDVVVRDAKGQFIPGLTIKDFTVLEDGVPQRILSFSASLGGRIVAESLPTKEIAMREGIFVPPSRNAPGTPGRIFIVFIDDLHLQGSDTPMVKAVLRDLRDTLLHEEDLVGIVSSGYSSIAFDLSPDPQRRRMNAAIDKVMGAAPSYRELIEALQTVDGPSGLRAKAFTAFRTAYEILEQLEKVTNRRKAFIYMSSGYDFNPLTDSRFQHYMDLYGRPATVDETPPVNFFERGHLQFSEADLNMALGELVRRAVRANVTFYTVDPRGLVAGPPVEVGLTDSEWARFINTSVSSLEVIAKETGGFSLTRTNGFKAGFQKIDNDLSDFYAIGYQSTNVDPMKVKRRIEIKVNRPAATVTTQKSSYMIKRGKRP